MTTEGSLIAWIKIGSATTTKKAVTPKKLYYSYDSGSCLGMLGYFTADSAGGAHHQKYPKDVH